MAETVPSDGASSPDDWSPTTFGGYARAYAVAARCLIDDVVAGRARRDIVVYAIGYAYRHALELALKHANSLVETAINTWVERDLLDAGARCSDRDFAKDLNSHNLQELLDRVEGRLAVVLDVAWIDTPVKVAIKALNLLDADAQKFRYPMQSRGRGPSFAADAFRRVDLELLGREVEGAIEFLTRGILYRLAIDLKAYRDLEEAWQAEMALEAAEERLWLGLYTYSAIDDSDSSEEIAYLRSWELGSLEDRSAELLGDEDEVGPQDRF